MGGCFSDLLLPVQEAGGRDLEGGKLPPGYTYRFLSSLRQTEPNRPTGSDILIFFLGVSSSLCPRHSRHFLLSMLCDGVRVFILPCAVP